MLRSLVGSEMCIRDSHWLELLGDTNSQSNTLTGETGADVRVHVPRVVVQVHRARTRDRTVAPIATVTFLARTFDPTS